MEPRNLTLLTDLYELTMMQGYFREKDANETVIFDAFYRTNPDGNAFSICAGLEQVIDYVKNLHFDDADIEYLRGLGILMKISSNIFTISNFRVTSTQSRKAPLSSRVSLSSRSSRQSWKHSWLRLPS